MTTGTENAGGDQHQADTNAGGKDTQQSQADAAALVNTPFGDLEKDTAEWLTAREVKDTPSLIKLARDKDSMVGKQASELAKAIKLPGKDAKPEELAEFRTKMGIPLEPDYGLKAPDNLPEGLPYDGERAKAFQAKAHELNLTKAQTEGLHEWFTGQTVEEFNGSTAKREEEQIANAKAETAKLVKLHGPLSGEQFKAQAAFADKALELDGGKFLAKLQAKGMIGDGDGQKIVQDADTFEFLAAIGRTLFTEGEVVKGDPSRMDNPFADGPTFNLTKQMALWRSDQKLAESFIRAAGKTPEELGYRKAKP